MTDPTRRAIVAQLAALTALACAGPDPAGGKPASTDDPGDGGADGGADGAGPDSGAADGGSTDSGSTDSGSTDSGSTDTGEGPTDPACDQGSAPAPAPCAPTPPDSEGPFWVDGVPEGAEMNRRPEEGTRLLVDLRVLDAACRPVEGVLVDLWHADQVGTYDMSGAHHARGRVTTGADGGACFQTIRPPPYGDGPSGPLPAHLHVMVLRDGVKLFTTQLYFADDPTLASSPKPAPLVRSPEDAGGGWQRLRMDLVTPIGAPA
jgi:protocatechuate 3,4-dioxygenase beta subunit